MAGERIRLDQPREPRRSLLPRWDAEAFGRVSERTARFLGTGRFIVWMSVVIVMWVVWNTSAPPDLRFDRYPFIFLTLALSLQASYAAPLILLAQNRQDDRDRVNLEQDRKQNERSIADTEYLTREIAALRLGLGEVATRDWIRSEFEALVRELEQRHPPTVDPAQSRHEAARPRHAEDREHARADERSAEAVGAVRERQARERRARPADRPRDRARDTDASRGTDDGRRGTGRSRGRGGAGGAGSTGRPTGGAGPDDDGGAGDGGGAGESGGARGSGSAGGAGRSDGADGAGGGRAPGAPGTS